MSLEVIWISVSLIGVSITSYLLTQSNADRDVVRKMNGRARLVAVSGDVRREALRLTVQVLLLVVAFSQVPREVRIGLLMAVPVVMCVQSALDLRERRRLMALLRNAP